MCLPFSLRGLPEKEKIIGNLSSFIGRTYPIYLNLSLIIAEESEIESHFVPSTLCIRSAHSKTFCRLFCRKTHNKSLPVDRSTHASEPCLTTFISIVFNVQILVYKLIFLFFQTFFSSENTLSLVCFSYNIFTS